MPKHLLFKTDNFKDYFLDTDEVNITYLPNVSSINIIIGSNNSGKSRFLRNLLLISQFIYVDPHKFLQYQKTVTSYNSYITSMGVNSLNILPLDFSAINKYLIGNNQSIENNRFGSVGTYRRQFSELTTNMIIDFKVVKRTFIPTLRSAHSLFQDTDKVAHDIYADTIKQNYKLESKGLKIFTGLHLYKDILRSRNSDKNTRQQFDKFEEFLSKSFFDGMKVDIVARFDLDERAAGKSDSELILIHVEGETETRKLFELGDGIQAIIILMYQIFMAEPDSFIYIDEPELHLHPGMQRLFLEQLCYNEDLKAKNLTYFITTHSNHFLDLTIEKDNVSIYAFSPRNIEGGQKQFVIKNVNAGDNDILKHLGVNNSSVFMANCSIWVEGVSDRNYIKAFLKAYTDHLISEESEEFKSIKEDIDYAFFEYAGSNIEHYLFNDLEEVESKQIVRGIKALALSNKIFLLADSDNSEGKKRERLEDLKAKEENNFIPYIIEEVREVENLLTNDIWIEILINFCNKKLVTNHSDEINNRLISSLSNIDSQDFKNEYIGKFLSKLRASLKDIDGVKILNESIYKQKNGKLGTFTLKRELSEFVFKKIIEEKITWEHLSKNPEIEKLTKEIYQFIISSKN